MRCLYVTQELDPYFVEGGLGVTAANLPRALSREYAIPHTVILPYYPRLATSEVADAEELALLGPVSLRQDTWYPTILRMPGTLDPEILFVRCDEWYSRDGGIYRDPQYVEYRDAVPRALFFGRCVARWIHANPGRYSLLHANDWQSGAAVFTLASRSRMPVPSSPRLLFNVHNGQYRGDLTAEWSGALLSSDGPPPTDNAAWPRQPSLLALGLLKADALATCSPSYATEFICSLTDPLVRDRVREMGITGIVSGVDYTEWGPDHRVTGAHRYTAATVQAGKRVNKRALQARCGIRIDERLPVASVCSRLVPEKGIDQILDGLAPLVHTERMQLVVVGRGEPRYHRSLDSLARRARGMVHWDPQFTKSFVHLLYAGSDFTLMPSLVEPCGLNQLISMHYGTLPIVHAVGGLNDTVTDLITRPGNGTGFVSRQDGSDGLQAVTQAAIQWLTGSVPAVVQRTRQRAMRADWSWHRTAGQYAALYSRLMSSPESNEEATGRVTRSPMAGRISPLTHPQR